VAGGERAAARQPAAPTTRALSPSWRDTGLRYSSIANLQLALLSLVLQNSYLVNKKKSG